MLARQLEEAIGRDDRRVLSLLEAEEGWSRSSVTWSPDVPNRKGTVTIKKGDMVYVWFSKGDFREGTAVGFSKAKRQIRVESPRAVRKGGIWHDFRTVYTKAEYQRMRRED